jgi:hypothetical protein
MVKPFLVSLAAFAIGAAALFGKRLCDDLNDALAHICDR